MKLRLGTRGSALALWQAEHVRDRLSREGHEVEVRKITTTGDRILDRRLETIGGKGAFLKEIEEALLAGEVDLAVHSLKDVPTTLPDGLGLCAFLERADPRDAVVSASGQGLGRLPAGARIGTTSLRRAAQVKARRPDLHIEDLRGNVDTRIRRLREGHFDAILLAMAGLLRLGRSDEVTESLDPWAFLPAPGQGVMALECRVGDRDVTAAALVLHHGQTERAVTAERTFLASLGGGCNVPLGAYAVTEGATVRLAGFVARPDGSTVLRAEAMGGDPAAVGRAAADDLRARGAEPLLAS